MLAFLANLGIGGLSLAKRGIGLLAKLNGWQILCLVLFCAAALFFVQRNNARADAGRIQVNLNEARAELKALSDKKNEQRTTTGKTIEQAERIARDADGVARGIETAPVAPDCRTPDEIMRADV